MSWSNQQRNVALKANSDLSAKQYLILELQTSDINLADVAGYDRGYGVLQNHPKSGENATVCVEGESRVVAGAAVTVGDYIAANSSGFAITVASGGTRRAGASLVMGRALSTAASGSVFTAAIDPFLISVASGGAI